jgi:hypothetical protein
LYTRRNAKTNTVYHAGDRPPTPRASSQRVLYRRSDASSQRVLSRRSDASSQRVLYRRSGAPAVHIVSLISLTRDAQTPTSSSSTARAAKTALPELTTYEERDLRMRDVCMGVQTPTGTAPVTTTRARKTAERTERNSMARNVLGRR